jgi:hypothetical protein
MKIPRRRQVDGARFRLQYGEETRAAKHPGANVAVLEAQILVEQKYADCVRVLDIDADDILYTVVREEKAVVTYAGEHGQAQTTTRRGVEAAV